MKNENFLQESISSNSTSTVFTIKLSSGIFFGEKNTQVSHKSNFAGFHLFYLFIFTTAAWWLLFIAGKNAVNARDCVEK